MGFRSLKVIFAVLFGLTAMAGTGGCQTIDPTTVMATPQLSFAHLGIYDLNVSFSDVRSLYEEPGKDPNIEHVMPLSPAKAALQWAHDRLNPQGNNKWQVRFLVMDGAVVRERLETKGGIMGFLTNEQGEKFSGVLSVVMEIRDEDRRVIAEVAGKAEAYRTVAEDASLADREKVWFELTETLMTEINAQLDASIQRYFKPYLMK